MSASDPSAATPEPAALRARLLALAGAHNRAVLAGVALGLLGALGLAGVALAAVIAGPAWAAVPALVLAAVLIGRASRLHGRVIRDLGPARRAAADLIALLRERGGTAPLAAVEMRLSREDLERALDLLGRLDLVYAEPAAGAAGDDLLRLDPEWARALEPGG